ncbi:RNA pyrophosphohydrolase [Rhodobacter sphaeroides]|uniref:RNA pyrophosphohydrolase n=1 Tax=Cereibacter sphaeroides TaxID=1063 RepID=UPI0013251623|nr:RNA pyrophosphohydrolase [Cereibacter sphaeroides]MWP36336.1 RNA pyrophosphohydrolase [Cereibacter sphaeroides]
MERVIDPLTLPYRPCVGIVLINREGLIFAGQRIDSPVPAWQMPQGGIDEGEKPREAALRELWEETGIPAERVEFVAKAPDWVTYDLPPELLGRVWGGKYRGQRQKWFLYRYLGTDEEVGIGTDHAEFSCWRWIGAEEMVAAIVPFKRAVYEEVVATFRPHLA